MCVHASVVGDHTLGHNQLSPILLHVGARTSGFSEARFCVLRDDREECAGHAPHPDSCEFPSTEGSKRKLDRAVRRFESEREVRGSKSVGGLGEGSRPRG